MKNNPLVTVITVVYNGETYIEQAILGVVNQSYKNIEYIIIDGKSTDGTIGIIKKYESQITKWISEPDKGIYDAMNKGLSMANGELIGIINCDDWYEIDTIEKVVGEYLNKPHIGVFSGLLRGWSNDTIYGVTGYSEVHLKSSMIMHPTCFIRKDVYEKNGLFDDNLKIAADYELMSRLYTRNVKFYLIESVLTNFRMGGASYKKDKIRQIEKVKIRYKYSFINKNQYFFIYFSILFRQLFKI